MFDKTALDIIKDYMLLHQNTIAVAESVTSGLIQTALASAENASLFYQGGITAYNIGQKYRHLFIEPIHALSCNCVSQKIAETMALSVCNLFNSNWGIGITGYAVPAPESGNELFAFYAVARNNKVIISKKITAKKDEPLQVQLTYINQLLQDIKQYLLNDNNKTMNV